MLVVDSLTIYGYNSGTHWSISLKFSTDLSTWQPIHSFKVKGSKVKVTAYVTGNADWLRNPCEFLAYLLLTRAWRHVTCICGCHAELPKTQYIRTKKTQKMLRICQIDWREVGVAFELQCLRNCTLARFFLLENIAFWEVPPGNHKCRSRGAKPLLN